LLDDIPSPSADGYQPFWALAAHLLAAVGRTAEAQSCFQRAIGLCDDPAMRAFLQRRSLAIEKGEVLDLTFTPA
jgi:RNA polymerase sigma-70 factor (ECF subfamily)